MDGFTWAAFALYLVGAIISVIVGLMYMTRREFMPYHGQAIGKTWAELDDKLKALLIGLIRAEGGGNVAVGLSLIAMLVFAFISRELWSYYTIPFIGLFSCVILFSASFDIKKKTGAKTPYIAPVVVMVLTVIGFVLSFF